MRLPMDWQPTLLLPSLSPDKDAREKKTPTQQCENTHFKALYVNLRFSVIIFCSIMGRGVVICGENGVEYVHEDTGIRRDGTNGAGDVPGSEGSRDGGAGSGS